jgi:hypothetical protein
VTTSTGVAEFRVRGVRPPRAPAVTLQDRVRLIDAVLAEGSGPIFLEVKRDDRPWEAWEADRDSREFLRVGLADGWGAAEYVHGPPVRNGRVVLGGSSSWIVRETVNPASTGEEPGVLSDECVPTFFPPDAVLPLDQIREVMIEFALHGTLANSIPWRASG